jgi:hypothetical protein
VDTDGFYDNSGDGTRIVLVAKGGIVVWQAKPLPEWVALRISPAFGGEAARRNMGNADPVRQLEIRRRL